MTPCGCARSRLRRVFCAPVQLTRVRDFSSSPVARHGGLHARQRVVHVARARPRLRRRGAARRDGGAERPRQQRTNVSLRLASSGKPDVSGHAHLGRGAKQLFGGVLLCTRVARARLDPWRPAAACVRQAARSFKCIVIAREARVRIEARKQAVRRIHVCATGGAFQRQALPASAGRSSCCSFPALDGDGADVKLRPAGLHARQAAVLLRRWHCRCLSSNTQATGASADACAAHAPRSAQAVQFASPCSRCSFSTSTVSCSARSCAAASEKMSFEYVRFFTKPAFVMTTMLAACRMQRADDALARPHEHALRRVRASR